MQIGMGRVHSRSVGSETLKMNDFGSRHGQVKATIGQAMGIAVTC